MMGSLVEPMRYWVTENLRIISLTSFNAQFFYVEIKCQLDATDDIYCRFYCLLNMFRAPLCPSSVTSNKICNKYHLLHLVVILFPHINDDARSELCIKVG